MMSGVKEKSGTLFKDNACIGGKEERDTNIRLLVGELIKLFFKI